MLHRIVGCTAIASAALWASAAGAVVTHDTDVPSNIIHGEGNQNGGFTVVMENNVVIGLRATVRYDLLDDQPKAIYNANGDGTFNHAAGAPVGNPDRARWNVTWSVDTEGTGVDVDSADKLSDYTYQIGLDYNPGVGTSFRTFDPINGVNPPGTGTIVLWDHGIGTRATGEGDGDDDFYPAATRTRDTEAEYLDLLAANTVAQNSWNWAFYDDPLNGFPFDPNLDGNYSVFFEVFDMNQQSVARADITVIVGNGAPVPAPAALGLLGLGLVGLMAARRRKA